MNTAWISAIGAVCGALIALAGVWLTQRATNHRDNQKWEREQRAEASKVAHGAAEKIKDKRAALYQELAEYAVSRGDMFDLPPITDPAQAAEALRKATDRLTARVQLYGERSVRQAWTSMMHAEQAFHAGHAPGTSIADSERSDLRRGLAVAGAVVVAETRRALGEHDDAQPEPMARHIDYFELLLDRNLITLEDLGAVSAAVDAELNSGEATENALRMQRIIAQAQDASNVDLEPG
ncbi:hypothetical protein ACIA5D_47835 [Actinoplanes sp. NPDC051513]|uniref:hypothetical protein n=1 Tax=Actinoplanes sp. NPDC051513 TaxID=3363908 RepID=UPI0037B1EF55